MGAPPNLSGRRSRRSLLRLSGAWILGLAFLALATPDWTSLAAGGAVALVGLAIRGWAAGVLEKDRELAVSGPYAFTRNPLYLGSFVIGVGVAVAGRRPWFGVAFLLYFAVAYRGAIARETRQLGVRFGERYRRYRDAVPAFFPTGAIYRPGDGDDDEPTSFSLRRYGRNREWEAALGALVGAAILGLKSLGWPG